MFSNCKLGLIQPAPWVLEKVPHILRFAADVPTLPLIADSCDYNKRTPAGLWGYLGNDQYGDCFWAAAANLLMTQQSNSGQKVHVYTTDDVLGWYASTGFNPRTGAGDNGTDPVQGLNWLQQQGVIEAWGQIDPTNDAHLAAAIELFGGIMIATDVPDDWMSSSTWGPNAGTVRGGHAIVGSSYTQSCDVGCETWAEVVKLLAAGRKQYCWGAYAVVTKQWIEANGETLQGFDLAGLKSALVAVQ